MKKSVGLSLIVVFCIAALGLLGFHFNVPSNRQGTVALPTATGEQPQISSALNSAPPEPEWAKPGTANEGYHFQLSEPPLPFLENYGIPTSTGGEDMEAVNQAVTAYLSAIPDNKRPPTGTNAEFTRVLSGDNALQVAFISQTHIVGGELTDRWGTPLFFHYVSGQKVDVSSAGPDKKFGTSDDISSNSDN